MPQVSGAILRTGLVPALLGLTLAGSLQAGPAVAERAPMPGASGMGDPYFPQDGNSGIEVLHYGVRDGYSARARRLPGRTVLNVRATQDLSRFDPDFLPQVLLIAVRQPSSDRLERHAPPIRPQPAHPASTRADSSRLGPLVLPRNRGEYRSHDLRPVTPQPSTRCMYRRVGEGWPLFQPHPVAHDDSPA